MKVIMLLLLLLQLVLLSVLVDSTDIVENPDPPSLQVCFPSSGHTFRGILPVRWTAYNLYYPTSVSISLVLAGTETHVMTLVTNTTNDGSFDYILGNSSSILMPGQMYNVRVSSDQLSGIFAMSEGFTIDFSYFPVQLAPYGASAPEPSGFEPFGYPFWIGQNYEGQRFLSLYTAGELGLSVNQSIVLYSLTIQIKSLNSVFLEINHFRADYGLIDATDLSSYQTKSDYEKLTKTFVNAAYPKTINVNQFSPNAYVTLNFSTGIRVTYPKSLVIEISSTIPIGTTLQPVGSPFLATTANLRTVQTSNQGEDWNAQQYPYPLGSGILQFAASNYVARSWFSASTQFPECGSVSQQIRPPKYSFQRVSGTGNFAQDCAQSSHPACRSNTASIFYEPANAMLVFGGRGRLSGDVLFNDLWLFQTNTSVWTRLSGASDCARQFTPACRYGHTLTLIGKTAYLVGGMGESGSILGASEFMYKLDVPTKLLNPNVDAGWTKITNTVRGVFQHAASAMGTKLYIQGGLAANTTFTSSPAVHTDQLFEFDTVAATWKDVVSGTACPAAICTTATCSSSSRCLSQHSMVTQSPTQTLVVFGGYSLLPMTQTATLTNAVWSFALPLVQWTNSVPSNCALGGISLPQCRAGHSAVIRNSENDLLQPQTEMLIFGGTAANDVWLYSMQLHTFNRESTSTKQCDEQGDSLPPCSTSQTAFVTDGTLFVFGGDRTLPGLSFLLNTVWAYGQTPFISSFQHVHLPTGGRRVVIGGRYFGTPMSLSMNNGDCTQLEVLNTSAVACDAPSGAGTNVSAKATLQRAGLSWKSIPKFVVSYDAPSISQLTIVGDNSTLGGTRMTVDGANFFNQDLKIQLGATLWCDSPQFVSPARVVCTTPAGGGVSLPVRVTVGGQKSAVSPQHVYSYAPATLLTIAGSSDASTLGGSILHLRGTNFGNPTSSTAQVTIGESAVCASPVIVNTTDIRCTAPAGTGAALNVIVSIDGQAVTFVERFSYSAPVLANMTFLPGSTQGGALLTIEGSQFGPSRSASEPMQVWVGGQGCTSLDWRGNRRPQQLVCRVPEGFGTGLAVVVSIGGQISAPGTDTYAYAPPQVNTVSPTVLYTDTTSRLTIQGQNFGNRASNLTVTIGGVARCSSLILAKLHREIFCDYHATKTEAQLQVHVQLAGTNGESVTSSQRVDVSIEVEPIDSDSISLIITLASLSLVLILCLWIGLAYNRKEKLMKASSILFSNLILFGALLSVSAVFLFQNNRSPNCVVSIFMVLVGFNLVYGTMVLKNFRILTLFQNTTMQRSLIKDSTLVGYLLGLIAIDIALLVPYALKGECGISDEVAPFLAVVFGIKVMLVVWGVYIAVQSRVIHISEFDEKHTLGYATYNVFFFVVILIPVIILSRNNVDQFYVLKAAGVLLVNCLTCCILFLPKFYKIYRVNSGQEDILVTDMASVSRYATKSHKSPSGGMMQRAPSGRSVLEMRSQKSHSQSQWENTSGDDESETSVYVPRSPSISSIAPGSEAAYMKRTSSNPSIKVQRRLGAEGQDEGKSSEEMNSYSDGDDDEAEYAQPGFLHGIPALPVVPDGAFE